MGNITPRENCAVPIGSEMPLSIVSLQQSYLVDKCGLIASQYLHHNYPRKSMSVLI